MLEILFEAYPGTYMPRLGLYVAAFSALVVLAVLFYVYLKTSKLPGQIKNTMTTIPAWLLSFGIIGYFLILFRLGGVPYLSMRFLLLILGACFIWYAAATILRLTKEIPKKRATLLKHKEHKTHLALNHTKRKKRKKR